MKFNKVQQLANDVHAVLSLYNRNYIKDIIGDSVNNNRALSVQQLIRFLQEFNPVLGAQVAVVREEVLEDLFMNRLLNQRSDAYDVNEFLAVLNDVGYNRSFVRSLGHKISKAA